MYAPYGEELLNQHPWGYDERFKFTGKERDTETGYLHFDARKFSDILGFWLSPDPLLDKYICNSPYVFCNGNPIAFIDMRGDSVSFSSLVKFDNKFNSNIVGKILTDLQAITGLSLKLNNGMLEYAKDENGNPIISKEGCSETARNHLLSIISNTQTIQVGLGSKSQGGGDIIRLSIKQINSFIQGAKGVDSRTLGYGMVFLHESFHTSIGGALKDDNSSESVINKMNIIRQELNDAGYNFGKRMSYSAYPMYWSIYIPFNEGALRKLNKGLFPKERKGEYYIKYH